MEIIHNLIRVSSDPPCQDRRIEFEESKSIQDVNITECLYNAFSKNFALLKYFQLISVCRAVNFLSFSLFITEYLG